MYKTGKLKPLIYEKCIVNGFDVTNVIKGIQLVMPEMPPIGEFNSYMIPARQTLYIDYDTEGSENKFMSPDIFFYKIFDFERAEFPESSKSKKSLELICKNQKLVIEISFIVNPKCNKYRYFISIVDYVDELGNVIKTDKEIYNYVGFFEAVINKVSWVKL